MEKLLAGATSEELRAMLVALGSKPPGTKQQRLAALVEHHSDPGAVAEVVARAPSITQKLLGRRADSATGQQQFIMFGSPGPDLEPGARWALDRGLLIVDRHRYGPARMPVEVALALRGPEWHAPFDPLPPSAQVVSVGRGHETTAPRVRTSVGPAGGPPTAAWAVGGSDVVGPGRERGTARTEETAVRHRWSKASAGRAR
ncbi:hypothetical protein [Streptomyces sp. ISL-86]|uniref:hypothetical protein n=1 Tax=Streptomyces sp. ISL-86 TaxID=2819187 RepID=UPI001BECD64D|nr:hypothetical protein [Streptomyces sp. ISL-86]MBT2458979.1 hypothetical protein [Streptomyces sp. ISL-86]